MPPKMLTPEEYAKQYAEREAASVERKRIREEWQKSAKKEKEELRIKLEQEYGVPHAHPRAETLFDLAWEEGHSFGLSEVEGHYADMVRLLPLKHGFTPNTWEY